MKKIVIAAFLILSVVAVNAKEKEGKLSDSEGTATVMLTGSIADEKSGESLVGVEVKLEGTDLKTYTDFDGNFSFERVKPGEYKLQANYISYQKESKVLNVNKKENNLEIKLQASN